MFYEFKNNIREISRQVLLGIETLKRLIFKMDQCCIQIRITTRTVNTIKMALNKKEGRYKPLTNTKMNLKKISRDVLQL